MNKTITWIISAIIIVLISTLILFNLADIDDVKGGIIILFVLLESILVVVLIHCYSIAAQIANLKFNLELSIEQHNSDKLEIAELKQTLRSLRRNRFVD